MSRLLFRSSLRVTVLLFVLIGGLVLVSLSPIPAVAQDGSACPPVVTQALASVGSACDGLGRNSACYGFQSVSATFAQPQPSGFFSRVGDTAGLTTLQTIRTAPLDLVRNRWGVALLNVQASLPNTLPGQTVTFLLLGDAEIENAVTPDAAFRGGIPVSVRTIAPTALHQQPTTSALIIATVAADLPLPADARTEDGWYRVASGGQYGWVEGIALTVPAPAARLPVFTPGTSSTPMQAFFLRTGAGAPVCSDAPDALIVQGPQELTIDLTVNGADLRVGSTVVIRTIPDREADGTIGTSETPGSNLEISVLDGGVLVNPDTDQQVVIDEGETTSTCLFEPANLGSDAEQNDQVVDPSCPWTEPQPIDPALREALHLLDQFPLQYPIPVETTPLPTAVPPTAVPPTAVPPTVVPPTVVPPTAVPPTAVPPTAVPVVVDLGFDGLNVVNMPYREGDTIFITHTIRNYDLTHASQPLTVDTPLPFGVTFSAYFGPGTYDPVARVLSISSIAANSAVNATFQVVLNTGTAYSLLTETATINSVGDSTPGNNNQLVSFFVSARADVAVTVGSTTTTPLVGVPFDLTYTVTNNGPTEAQAIELPINLAGLTAGTPIPSQGSFDPITGIWTVGTLNPTTSATLILPVTAPPPTAGVPQTVTGGTVGGSHNTDGNSLNNNTSLVITPVGVVCNPSSIASAAALIAAIENANNEVSCPGANTIGLSGGLISFAASYDGTNALPPITSSITINGNVSNLSAGAGGFRLLTIAASGVLQLNRVRINSFSLLTSDGGAIVMNGNAGSKFLNVTLNNNTGVNGGAIYHSGSAGVLTLVNVTLFDNTAGGSGSAIFAASSGNVDVSFGTLWNVTSGGAMLAGGGGASIDLKNSIIGGLGNCMSGSLVVGNGGGNATTFGDGSCATFSTPTLTFASFAGGVGNGLPTVTFNTVSSTHFNTASDCTDLTLTAIAIDARDLTRPIGTFCDPGVAEQL